MLLVQIVFKGGNKTNGYLNSKVIRNKSRPLLIVTSSKFAPSTNFCKYFH